MRPDEGVFRNNKQRSSDTQSYLQMGCMMQIDEPSGLFFGSLFLYVGMYLLKQDRPFCLE